MTAHFASATCPNCQTLFDRLPLDGDDDGCCVVIEAKPCATCGQMLCSCCAQFCCGGCGQPHCLEHRVEVPDGTPTPLKCCALCAAECEFLEPLVVPAAMCPDCGSDELVAELHHGGIDPETGYHDSQEFFHCLTCGARGPAEDAEVKSRVRFQVERERKTLVEKPQTA